MKVSTYVKHDRLDDEVMVIDLDTGAYFALDGAAGDAWSLLAAGLPLPEIVAAVSARYAVAASVVDADLRAFVADLLREKLILDEGETERAEMPQLPAVTSAYAAPRSERLDELNDLLLLDPVHEVKPTGWPAGRDA